jgi:hypothetical protein
MVFYTLSVLQLHDAIIEDLGRGVFYAVRVEVL